MALTNNVLPGAVVDATDASREPNTAKRAWLVVSMVLIMMVINAADKTVLGLVAKPMSEELGLTPDQYGWLASGFFLLFGIASIVVGFISTRVKTKWILLALVLIWSVTQIPMMLAAAFPLLLVSRIALGAAEGPTMAIATHSVQKWFPRNKRSLPTALVFVGAALGVVIGAPAIAWVIAEHGWRWAFISLAVIGLVWAVVWVFAGKEGPYATFTAGLPDDDDAAATEVVVQYRKLLLNPTWLAMLVASFGSYFAVVLLLTWVPTYLEDVHGYSTVGAGSAIALPRALSLVFELIIPVLAGWLVARGVTSRTARGKTSAVIALVGGVSVLAFPHTAAGSIAQIASMSLGFGLPAVLMVMQTLILADMTPVRQRGPLLGIGVAVATSAGLVAPSLMGHLVESSVTPAAGFELGFLITATTMIVGGILVFFFADPEREIRKFGLGAASPTAP